MVFADMTPWSDMDTLLFKYKMSVKLFIFDVYIIGVVINEFVKHVLLRSSVLLSTNKPYVFPSIDDILSIKLLVNLGFKHIYTC